MRLFSFMSRRRARSLAKAPRVTVLLTCRSVLLRCGDLQSITKETHDHGLFTQKGRSHEQR